MVSFWLAALSVALVGWLLCGAWPSGGGAVGRFLRRGYGRCVFGLSVLGPVGFLGHWAFLFCPWFVFDVLLRWSPFPFLSGYFGGGYFLGEMAWVFWIFREKEVRFWDVRVWFGRERRRGLNWGRIREMHEERFGAVLWLLAAALFAWGGVAAV